MTDRDLSLTEHQVRAAQSGDREALDELFSRYLPRVRRLVAARTSRTVEQLHGLDDIVQETFRDTIASIATFEARSDGAFCSWLARCVENNVRDQVRRHDTLKRGGGEVRRFSELDQSSLSESIFGDSRDPSPSQVASGHETESRIEAAMLKLADRYREVIGLRVFGQMSYREIAEEMGLPTENTANLLFLRAREKLRRLLGE